MSKKCKLYLLWFIAGQVVQVIANILAKTNYMARPILFCIAAGFIMLVAVGVGMWVAGKEKQPTPKSYREWAETEWDNG